MGALETTVIGGAAAVGGWLLFQRLHGSEHAGGDPGAGLASQAGNAIAASGRLAGGAVRTGGAFVSKTAGLTVRTAFVVVEAAPLLGAVRNLVTSSPSTPPPVETAVQAPAKKAPAKKAAAKKTPAKKAAAKKAPAKKGAAKKAPAKKAAAEQTPTKEG